MRQKEIILTKYILFIHHCRVGEHNTCQNNYFIKIKKDSRGSQYQHD